MEDFLEVQEDLIGHVSPEAMDDGPIGLLKDGDILI